MDRDLGALFLFWFLMLSNLRQPKGNGFAVSIFLQCLSGKSNAREV